MCQSDESTKAWYSRADIERFEYRHAITNAFFSSRQSLLTTSHSNVSPELTTMFSTSPAFGMVWSVTTLMNLMSLFAIVSIVSFPWRRTRNDGILRLISTVWAIGSVRLPRIAHYREPSG
jgi:hypothetical protein